MKKNCLQILFLFLALSGYERARAQDTTAVKADGKNHLYLLAGAPSMYAGISYEYSWVQKKYFSLMPRAGIGLNFLKPTLARDFNLQLGMTMLAGKKRRVELGAGSIHYMLNQTSTGTNDHYYIYKFGLYGSLCIRYQFERLPLGIKAGMTTVCFSNPDKWVVFFLPELGAGIRF